MLDLSALFDLSHTKAEKFLKDSKFAWLAVAGLKNYILSLGETLGEDYVQIKPSVWVHKSVEIAASAYIGSPSIIGAGTQIRHCAYIRGSALIGDYCVVGNSCEIKNSVLFDGVQIPHFNYAGDSIIGFKAHFGAGVITANVRSDKREIKINSDAGNFETGLKKCGAFVGDFAEIGCNAVLCPGTVIGRGAVVYPLSRVRGEVKENSVFK